jgi:hypothetical protein
LLPIPEPILLLAAGEGEATTMAKTQLPKTVPQNGEWINNALAKMPLVLIVLIFHHLAPDTWTTASGLVAWQPASTHYSQFRGSQGARPDAAHEPGAATSYGQFIEPMFQHYPPDLLRPEQYPPNEP